MRIDPATAAVVISENDSEALAIVDLLENGAPGGAAAGVAVLAKPAGWGADIALAQDDLSRLDGRDVVVLVEQPSATLERQLARAGKTVIHIDHHLYARPGGDVVDRRHPSSSLEQVAAAFGVAALDPQQRLISENDRGYIPALAAEVFRQRRDALRQVFAGAGLDDGNGNNADYDEADARAFASRLSVAHDTRLPAAVEALQAAVHAVRRREVAIALALHHGRDAAAADEDGAEDLITEIEAWLDAAGGCPCHRELSCRETGIDAPALHLLLAPIRYRWGLGDALYRRLLRRHLHALRAPSFDEMFEATANQAGRFRRRPGVVTAWLGRLRAALTERHDVLSLFVDDADWAGASEPSDLFDAGMVRQLEFSGGGGHAPLLTDLLLAAGRPHAATGSLSMWIGGSDGCFLGAAVRLDRPSEREKLDGLADRILNNVLGGNRPVVAWRAHFFQPMIFNPPPGKTGYRTRACLRTRDQEAGSGETTDMGEAAAQALKIDGKAVLTQERTYFLPHLREFLLPATEGRPSYDRNSRLHSLWVAPPAGESLSLRLRWTERAPRRPLTLPLHSVRVHHFFNRTLLVEWVVGYEEVEIADGLRGGDGAPGPYWARLLAWRRPPDGIPCMAAEVMEVVAKARMTSSPFRTTAPNDLVEISLLSGDATPSDDNTLEYGAHVTDERARTPNAIEGWFRTLATMALTPLDLAPGSGIEPAAGTAVSLNDERGRVAASMVLSGGNPDTEPGRRLLDVMFSRWLSVDGWGGDFAYDGDFARREMRAGRYDRFAGWGSLYGASSHSFVFLGFDEPYFVRPHIHRIHMRTLYRRMYMLILFYEVILNKFALDLTRLAQNDLDDGGTAARLETEMQTLREDFLTFTNGLWFAQVTSQIQGRELFALMRAHSTIDAEYQLILGEIERTDQYYDDRQSRAVRRLDIFVRRLGLPIAAFLTLTGLKEDWVAGAFPYYDGIAGLRHAILWLLSSGGESGAPTPYWSWNFAVNVLMALFVAGSVLDKSERRRLKDHRLIGFDPTPVSRWLLAGLGLLILGFAIWH